MEKNQTFKNLAVLKAAQENVKKELGDKYEELVQPYIEIIGMVMQANSINEFESLKMIKEKLPI